MKKTLRNLLFFGGLAIMYLACQKEYTDSENPASGKEIETLTVEHARELYEEYIGNMPQLRNSQNDNSIKLVPDWIDAGLFADSVWISVESPLSFLDDHYIKFMTDDVYEAYQSEQVSEINQIQRLIILQDKEMHTYAFVMLVIPSLEYMQKGKKTLSENKYLEREPDFDGLILYFTVDGRAVNGWVYEKGVITMGLQPADEDSHFGTTRGWAIDYCIPSIFIDDEYGLVAGTSCYMITDAPPSGGGVSLPDIGEIGYGTTGGTGGPDANDTVENPKNAKEPDKRNDCAGNATTNAANAQNAMAGSTDIKSKISTLIDYAKSRTNEWGMSIEYRNGTYRIDSQGLREGVGGSFMGSVNGYTAYGMHSHCKGTNSRIIYFPGPSGGDIDGILIANHALYQSNRNPNYRGEIITTYDGSQYLVYINDVQKAYNFYNKYGNAFETLTDAFSFKNEDIRNDFQNTYDQLIIDGYSDNNAYDYAMSYVLDKYDTGLKLSKKESFNAQFKEMKTDYNSYTNVYQPKICP